jgi:predicted nucleic acid-binding Zn ribbon protein
MTHWRRSPRPFALAIDLVRDELAPATLLARVQRAWPEAVGPAISAEAQPTSERGGVVTISCSAAVWAQELDLMSPTIVGRLNEALSEDRIERLRCVAVPFSEEPR